MSRSSEAGPHHGAFAQARTIPLTRSGEWRTVKILLPNVRFANRANDADLRFGVMGGDRELAVRAMSLRLIESSSQPARPTDR